MDRFAWMRSFVAVAENGGFSAAARRLNLSKAVVSKHVGLLEEWLGVRLFHRTTRRLHVTEAGTLFLQRAGGIIAELAEAEEEVAHLQVEPKGKMRVTAPISFGQRHLAPAVGEFLARHPGLTMELFLSDRHLDLVEEGLDLAVRIGELADSSLVARRLAPVRFALLASPAYLARRGEPERPADLARHDCLLYTYRDPPDEWTLRGASGVERVRVGGRLAVNNGDFILELALAGLGVAVLPTFIAGEAMGAGRLRRILPGWGVPEAGLFAVTPGRRFPSNKVRLFVEFLVSRLGSRPYWDAEGVGCPGEEVPPRSD